MGPKQVSDMDQAFAGLEDTAKVLGAFRSKLVEQGFSKNNAEQMCVV